MKDLEADGDRVQRIGDEDASPSRSRRPRTAHACEPCRQRKIKCRGEWPNCGQCRHLNLTCSYGQSKEDGKKRFSDSQGNRTDKGLGAHGMGDHIRRKLKAYESILCKLIPQVGDEDRAAIRQCLLMVITFAHLHSLTNTRSPHNSTRDYSIRDFRGPKPVRTAMRSAMRTAMWMVKQMAIRTAAWGANLIYQV